MRRCFGIASAIAAACLCLMVACGADDDPGSGRDGGRSTGSAQADPVASATTRAPKAKPLSRGAYRRKADRVCGDVVRRALRVRREYFFNPRGRDLGRGFTQLTAAVEKGLRRLRRLASPRGDEDAIERIHAQAASGLEVLRRAQRDRRLASRIVRAELDPFKGAATAARAYGIARCVSP
jgi:hypothetical protein